MQLPDLKEMNRMLADMERRRNEWRRENPDRNQYIKDQAVETGTILGVEYWIVPGPSLKKIAEADGTTEEELERLAPSLKDIMGGLNGYAVFPQNWVKERGYNGILDYVPVHWGITYNETDNMGQVFGFDTAHVDSGEMPRLNRNWIKDQITIMIRGVNMAHGIEQRYLKGTTNRQRGYYAQKVYDVAEGEAKPGMTMGMMINVMGGQL